MVGETLSHYRVIEQIGTGGMGVVYRAHDEQLDRDVALKVLPAGTLSDDAARKRFRREALALAKFNHPNIAIVHEFNSQAGVDFLAMELINGRSLREILKNGPLSEKDIQILGVQLTEGLVAAHEHGVIHRDLKPANIMITPEGRLKILDFGLAKLAQAGAAELAPSSSENEGAPGTLPYMAPEQLQGEPADTRTDVYGAGAVLYEMATGRRPFPEAQAPQLIHSVLHRSPQPPRELNPQLSPGMQAAILKTLEKDPGERYQSAREFRSELERLGSGVAASQLSAPLDTRSKAPPLEIAHVLFMDLVEYSTSPMDQQRRYVRVLEKAVRGTSEFTHAKSSDHLISIPTGDGMALVFFEDFEAPVRCAMELSRALKNAPEIRLRIGIHTGPVYRVADINADHNVSGGGINIAQRVMDCGDAGHILISKAAVDVLSQLSCWNCSLHDLGEVEVKHGLRLHLYNFYTEEVGNPARPTKTGAGRISRTLGPPLEKKARTPRPGSAPLRRRKSEPPVPARSPVTPGSSRTHTLQIVVPEMSRRAWLFAAAILLVLVSVTLAIPSVRSRLFGLNTMSSPPEGVPSLAEGNFLAVLPIEVQGEVDTLGDIAQGLNEEVSRKLSLLQALHVVSAAEAEDKAAKLKFDLKGPVETTARNLGANLVLQVTTALHTGGWIRLNLNLQDVADRRVVLRAHFSSNVLDGPLTLAERIFMEILKALKLTLSKEEETRAASPTSSFQAYAFYLKGRTAFKNHREQPFNVAVGFFEQAVKQDPGFALAYAELANVNRFLCRGTGDKSCWIKVLEIAQKASALNDGLPEVRWALAAVYSETGRYDEAIAEHKQVLQLARTSDEGWRRLGQTYKSARQKEQSIEAFTKAVMVNSYSIYNRNELGIAYLENGQYHDAESTFRQEIKLNPDYYAGYLNVGEVYRYQAKYDDAVNEYLEALQHHPDVEVYTGLGLAYLYLKRYNDAIKMLEKGVELNPNEETVGSLADGYHWSGENEKAQANYDRAILLAKNQLATNPKLADVLDHLGLYYAKRGNAALADQYIGRARSLDPSDPRLIYDEAIVRALANQPTRAMDSLRLAFGGDGNLARRATFEPALGSLQSRPEFKKLVANFNRPESGQAFAPTLPKVADSTR